MALFKKKKMKALQIFISLLISAVLIYYFLKAVSLKDILSVFSKIKPVYLVVALIVYAILIYVRGLRLRVVLEDKISKKNSFKVMAYNNLFMNLLPFRLGELSLLYFLKKSGIHLRRSLPSLIIIRVFDFIALILIFFISFLLLRGDINIPAIFLWWIIILLLLLTVFLFLFIYRNKSFLRLHKKFIKRIKIDKHKVIKYITKKLELVFYEMNHLKSKKKMTIMLIQSLITWFLIAVMLLLIFESMSLSFPFIKLMLGSSFQTVLNIIPIQGFANFGTYEAYWVIIFNLLGMSKETAIISGFNTHIIQIIILLVLTALIWLFMRKKNK